MKKTICILLMLLTVVCLPAGCKDDTEKTKKLTVYCTEEQEEAYKNNFKYYNDYCLLNQDFGPEYQIEYITFKNDDELYRKASTEIMAGGGPDIFFTAQLLPFEKMIGAGTFADIDEAAKKEGVRLDFSDCNKRIMDSGVWNGKRYIIPVVYSARLVSSDKKSLKNAGLNKSSGDTLTYTDLSVPLKNGITELSDSFTSSDLTEKLIYDCVDMKDRKVNFSGEFRESLRALKKLYGEEQKQARRNFSGDEYYQAYYDFFYPPEDKLLKAAQYSFADAAVNLCCTYRETAVDFFYDKKVAGNNVLMKGISTKENSDTGYIDLGIAVNRNSKKLRKALEFIKYSISKTGQSHLTSPYGGYAFSSSFPVNNKIFKKRIINAGEYTVFKSDERAVDSDIMKEYIKLAGGVRECLLYGGNSYYTINIADKLLQKYFTDEISENKFIRQLSSATRFYLEE